MDNNLIKGKIDQYFSSNFEKFKADGFASGRKLFVSKDSLKTFDAFVSEKKKSFNALYFFNQIMSLKNVGYLSSQFSRVSPILKRLRLEGGEIIYAVWGGNIYITQINAFQSESGKFSAGVYKVRNTGVAKESWAVELKQGKADQRSAIDTVHLAINGYAETLSDAAAFMPGFIRYGFGEGALGNVYSLFYNPSTSANNSDWRSLKDTLGFTTQAAKKLADVLVLTSTRAKPVNLTVHENGHALLRESLKLIADKNVSLDKITVFYANPTQNLNSVDMWRKRSGMRLAEKAPLVNPLSVHQNFLAGNVISQPLIACRAQPANRKSTLYNAAKSVVGLAGLGSIGAGFLGAAGWALSVSPFLVGQSRSLNAKAIDSPGKVFQEGVNHYSQQSKKLIWDPVHKMLVKE